MKENKLAKIITYVVAAIAIIGVILLVRVLMTGEDADIADLNRVVSPLVAFSQYLFYAAVLITVVLSLLGLLKNPDNLKKTLLGLVVLGGIFMIAYFTSGSDAVLDSAGKILEGGEAGASSNKLAGAGITFSLILGAVGLFFFVIDLVKGLIKT